VNAEDADMRYQWSHLIWVSLLGLVIISGCTSTAGQENTPDIPPLTEQATKIVEEREAQSANSGDGEGIDELQICRDEETGSFLSYDEAVEIARDSTCAAEGQLTEIAYCNGVTGTWWIDMEVEKPGCAPACVVDVNNGTAEINWRCTGLVPEGDASPTAIVENQEEVSESGGQIAMSFNGISFSIDGSLATGASQELFSEEPFLIVDGEIIPEHEEYLMLNYLHAGTLHEPRIWVYPLEAFAQGNYLAAAKIEKLQQLLADRPAEIETAPFSEAIPILPLFNAGQMMASQIEYLDFQNGSGLRFLTQLGQSYMPINNLSMFYTFQGITRGGQYYVAAIFPVSHPSLPPNGTMPEDAEGFIAKFDSYIAGLEDQLDAEEEASFTPNLGLLDALIRSMQVIKG
jgi:hypothetical protein